MALGFAKTVGALKSLGKGILSAGKSGVQAAVSSTVADKLGGNQARAALAPHIAESATAGRQASQQRLHSSQQRFAMQQQTNQQAHERAMQERQLMSTERLAEQRLRLEALRTQMLTQQGQAQMARMLEEQKAGKKSAPGRVMRGLLGEEAYDQLMRSPDSREGWLQRFNQKSRDIWSRFKQAITPEQSGGGGW